MCVLKLAVILFSMFQLLIHGESSETNEHIAQQSRYQTGADYSNPNPQPEAEITNVTSLGAEESHSATMNHSVTSNHAPIEGMDEKFLQGQAKDALNNPSLLDNTQDTFTDQGDLPVTFGNAQQRHTEFQELGKVSSTIQYPTESYEKTTSMPEEELSTFTASQTTTHSEGHIQFIPVISKKNESTRSYNAGKTPEYKNNIHLELGNRESQNQHQLNVNTKYFVESAQGNTSDKYGRHNSTVKEGGGIHFSLLPTYQPGNMPEVYPYDGRSNITSRESHPCARPCVEGASPMVCRYKFELEWYYTMSKACYDCPLTLEDCNRQDCVVADGVKRPIVVVNRQLPGPSVEVCKGDKIVVDLENHMMEESTTIHWHGHHQRGTPYMDGVPYVTQCPIPPKSTFRYHYSADTPGTHFWHSHSGCQRADGAFGALIIRVPPMQDPHRNVYDRDLTEHIVQVLDWNHKLGVDKFVAHHHSNGNNKPETLLVNGRGRFFQFEDVNLMTSNSSHSPTAVFTVQKGFRYRFRLINAGFLNCPIEVSVDNHTLLVISSDGADLKPVEAHSLVTYAGERFDFVINADKIVGNYWMRFRGLMDGDERFTKAHQVAVLHYEGAPELKEPPGEVSYEAARRTGLTVNSLNVGTGRKGTLVIPELNAVVEEDESLKEKPDMTFYLSYDFYKLDNPHFHRYPFYGFHQVHNTKLELLTPQLNHISLKLPPFPLLSQHENLHPHYPFCNETTEINCENKYCECTYVIEVKLGAVMELILIDKGMAYDANHPFHLHGHAFRVIAMDRINSTTTVEEVQALDKAGLIHRKLRGAPLKDTVTVPDGGYTIVRVHANNPGYWLFHCHIEFHVELGMAVVFKVGDHSDFPPVPPGFPQCNSYLPSDHDVEQINNVMDNIVDTHGHFFPQPYRSTAARVSSPLQVLHLMLLLVFMAVR